MSDRSDAQLAAEIDALKIEIKQLNKTAQEQRNLLREILEAIRPK